LELIRKLRIDSLRAEITFFEAMRAFAALDNRKAATLEDLQIIAPMALRMRRSEFIDKYLNDQSIEEREINNVVKDTKMKS
jgi:magnesium chelatase subunit I